MWYNVAMNRQIMFLFPILWMDILIGDFHSSTEICFYIGSKHVVKYYTIDNQADNTRSSTACNSHYAKDNRYNGKYDRYDPCPTFTC